MFFRWKKRRKKETYYRWGRSNVSGINKNIIQSEITPQFIFSYILNFFLPENGISASYVSAYIVWYTNKEGLLSVIKTLSE